MLGQQFVHGEKSDSEQFYCPNEQIHIKEFEKEVKKEFKIRFIGVEFNTHCSNIGWLRGTVVERRSLTGKLSLSCG